jgi:hypothetical protein
MKRVIIIGAIMIMLGTLLVVATGCFGNASAIGNNPTVTPEALKPKPKILPVVATTTGTANAYYAVLDIKVKNEGAEGVVLVKANLSQAGATQSDEMPVYLKHNETHELKLTFKLVWKGGDFQSDVQAIVP